MSETNEQKEPYEVASRLSDRLGRFLDENGAKLYGDNFIGYRSQKADGSYLDTELIGIYLDFGGNDNCDEFNAACYELRCGDHNW